MQYLSKPVGIDLGTTNSAVAVMDPTDSNILIHRDPKTKRETTPSCVWKNPTTREIIVGHQAFSRIGTAPSPIRSIKRLMGQQTPVRLTDEDASPEQISAYILSEMKRLILQDFAKWNSVETEWIADRAIITVPAYFDTDQIEATRNAGKLAGLDVVELLHEPTAAACYHCWRTNRHDGTFLVYDLGGGTFDVSVLRSSAGAFEVLGISGNRRLGGDDLDQAIAELLLERLLREDYALNLDPKKVPDDRLLFDKLKFLAESIKKALSKPDSFEFVLRDTSLQDKQGQPIIIDSMFERGEVDDRIRPIVERTLPYCTEALKQAVQKAGGELTIDEVILAGGSTHTPLVRELVKETLCGAKDDDGEGGKWQIQCAEPVYHDVDTLVALGAAIRAAASGGLAVYNSEKSVRVSFRGTGSTGSKKTHVGGRVESLPPGGIALGGGRVRLGIADLAHTDEADLNEAGAFAFRDVPLQPGAENQLSFEVFDRSGACVATVGRPVAQKAEKPRPTGGSASTAVQSKPLLLEVTKDGKQVHFDLIPALKTLPADENFDFKHPGNTEVVLFPLYSQKRKIKEIKVPIDSSLPRGTPITMNVRVDELAFITVKGKVGEVDFEASVEPPPPRAMPTEAEAQKLHAAFKEGLQYLQKGKQAVAQTRYDKARKSFEAAASRGDHEQAIHDYEEMEEIVAGLSKAEAAVEPPRQFFDKLVEECHEINKHAAEVAAKAGKPHDHREVGKAIEAQRQQGEKAHREGNQKRYSDAIMMLESIKNQVIALLQSVSGGDKDDRSPGEKAKGAAQGAGKQAGEVAGMADSVGRKDLADEAKQIRKDLDRLAHEAQKDPTTVREKVSQLWGRLEQIKNTLMGKKDDGRGGKTVEM